MPRGRRTKWINGKKPCSKCGKNLPKSEYYKKSNKFFADGEPMYYSHCKNCHRGYCEDWIDDNYERYRELITDWQKANPHKLEEYKKKRRAAIKAHNKAKKASQKPLDDNQVSGAMVCPTCGTEVKLESH